MMSHFCYFQKAIIIKSINEKKNQSMISGEGYRNRVQIEQREFFKDTNRSLEAKELNK
jgi:hypothetical protein